MSTPLCAGKRKGGGGCQNKGCYTSFLAQDKNLFCWHHVHKSDESCAICLNGLYDVEMLSCGHMFHNGCIRKWTKYRQTCPVCRCIVFGDTVNIMRRSDNASIQMTVTSISE